MRLINGILKIDYSLSAWLSSTKQAIIPAAAFIFLNKLAFLITATYFIVLPLLPFQLGVGIAIAILCGIVLFIMYGLQSKIQDVITNLSYFKEYSERSHREKVLHRIYGLAMFIGCFILMFVIGVVSFTGYGQ